MVRGWRGGPRHPPEIASDLSIYIYIHLSIYFVIYICEEFSKFLLLKSQGIKRKTNRHTFQLFYTVFVPFSEVSLWWWCCNILQDYQRSKTIILLFTFDLCAFCFFIRLSKIRVMCVFLMCFYVKYTEMNLNSMGGKVWFPPFKLEIRQPFPTLSIRVTNFYPI